MALSLMQTLAPSRAPGSRQDDRVLFTRVRIVGPSMEPGVLNDDWWLVRRTTDVRPGDVIEYYFEAADNYPKGAQPHIEQDLPRGDHLQGAV